MAYTFGSLVFTPAVQALQERYGSRRQYARMEAADAPARGDRIGPDEREFLAERDSFYMASIGSTGWPYVQHRGGPEGFLKVIDERTLAFADFRGNKQFVTTGNLATESRVSLILVDYPRQARLKILGTAEVLEGDRAKDWIGKVRMPDYQAVVERVVLIHVQALDWNCPQHITPRYTADQLRDVLAPVERQMQELNRENERLRAELAVLRK